MQRAEVDMRAICLSLFVAAPAFAGSITGKLEDPALRRKVQLVYVEKVDAKPASPAPAVINQRGNVYLPHLTAVVQGQKVLFKSEDPELHNVFARAQKGVVFNEAVLPKMQSTEKTMTELGPVHLTCNIHKEMSAWIVVLQNKFFALPEKDGSYKIDGLPPGQYTVRVWGEELSDDQKQKTFAFTVGSSS
jgi:plastocyanin